MRVLFPYNPGVFINPFVGVLSDALQKLGVNVTCSMQEFWENWREYDVIHLQWPDLFLGLVDSAEQLNQQFAKIKKDRIPIVITCHNLAPHYSKNRLLNQLYASCYEHSDVLIHMGDYSYRLLKEKYPFARHVVIPHHIYDTLYPRIPSREEALAKLGLDSRNRYILCFGAFRDDEEREIAIRIAQYFGRDRYVILAPGFYNFIIQKKRFWITISNYLKYFRYKKSYPEILFKRGFVPENMIAYYYAASDFALIQRRMILNSGNLPMGLMMGKVVVGPNVGNVGEILRQTGNPVFDPSCPASLIEAVKEAILMAEEKGKQNRKFALEVLNSEKIGAMHKALYCTTISSLV